MPPETCQRKRFPAIYGLAYYGDRHYEATEPRGLTAFELGWPGAEAEASGSESPILKTKSEPVDDA